MKLPEEFKKKWVEALRSGEYKQAKGLLCNEGGFCCMGVAYVVATGIKKIYGTSILHDHQLAELVPKCLVWPNDLSEPDSRDRRNLIDTLAEMND